MNERCRSFTTSGNGTGRVLMSRVDWSCSSGSQHQLRHSTAYLVMHLPVFVLTESWTVTGNVASAARLGRSSTAIPANLLKNDLNILSPDSYNFSQIISKPLWLGCDDRERVESLPLPDDGLQQPDARHAIVQMQELFEVQPLPFVWHHELLPLQTTIIIIGI